MFRFQNCCLGPIRAPYYLCATRLDALFDRLFVLCGIKPDVCLRGMSQHTLRILQWGNPFFSKWFPREWFEEEAPKRVIAFVPAHPSSDDT